MDFLLQKKLNEDKKMDLFLKQNSYWYKELNRNSDNYKNFVNAMKEKYRLKVSDRINDAIDSIDLITGVLDTLK